MNRHRLFFGGCAVTTLFAFALSTNVHAANTCSRQGVAINSDFPAGAMQGCVFTADNAVTVQISPEAEPINPSPWYAIRIETESAINLQVTLAYGEYKHRYSPDLQIGDGPWQTLPDSAVSISEDEFEATVSLDLPASSQALLAGQPLMDSASYQDWMHTLPTGLLSQTTIGQSAEGRPLWRLESTPKAETLLILGRQHPPETTGAQAMKFFIERLLADDDLARQFRDQVGLIVYPLLNPDGVDNGHWRLNMGGIDLNRDWGPFTQPETTQVNADIDAYLAQHETRLIKALDFHSTYREVFYTQEDDTATVAPELLPDWLAGFEAQMIDSYPDFEIDRSATHNPDRPTAKSYFSSRFNVASTTVEMDDNSTTEFIRDYAIAAAESLMRAWPKSP